MCGDDDDERNVHPTSRSAISPYPAGLLQINNTSSGTNTCKIQVTTDIEHVEIQHFI